MSQETGKEAVKETPKLTVEELTTKLEAAEKEKAELLKETMSRKEKLKELETKNQKAEEARLTEEGKFKELFEKANPKLERLNSLLPVLENIFNLEIQDIQEDKRELIPNLDIEKKIEWVKRAKSKGLFGAVKEEKKAPVGSVQSKTAANPAGLPEFASWPATDPRVGSLKPGEYEIWKKHNRKDSGALRGWGG